MAQVQATLQHEITGFRNVEVVKLNSVSGGDFFQSRFTQIFSVVTATTSGGLRTNFSGGKVNILQAGGGEFPTLMIFGRG